LASDPTSLKNLLENSPELRKELDITLRDALAKVDRHRFQCLKEQVIIAEAFFNEKPDLPEDDQRAVVALIKDGGDLKELKTHLKGWGTSAGGQSSFISMVKSFFTPKEQTPRTNDGATRQTKRICDWEFLATLPDKVSKEPLLQHLVKDTVAEAHRYFQEFLKQRLPKLCTFIQGRRQKMIYHKIELEANAQNQKRQESSRNDWFDGIKLAQPQMNVGYATLYLNNIYHLLQQPFTAFKI